MGRTMRTDMNQRMGSRTRACNIAHIRARGWARSRIRACNIAYCTLEPEGGQQDPGL